jgi:hypothetical protein
LGAKPHSLIAELKNGSWQVVRDGLPRWVSSVVVKGDELILIGNEKGQLYAEIRAL